MEISGSCMSQLDSEKSKGNKDASLRQVEGKEACLRGSQIIDGPCISHSALGA